MGLEDLIPGWLINTADKFTLDVVKWSYNMGFSLALLEHPYDMASGFPQSEGSTKEQRQSLNVASEVTICHFHSILLVTEVSLSPCGRGIYTDMTPRREGSLGAIREIGYDTELTVSTNNNNHTHQRNNYKL